MIKLIFAVLYVSLNDGPYTLYSSVHFIYAIEQNFIPESQLEKFAEAFFISLHYASPLALLHRHALMLDRLLAFLMAFSILVYSQSFSLYSHLSLPQADVLEF